MSPSRRTAARPLRLLGAAAASAALVVGASGSALASEITDFSATAACDGERGFITVTATDAKGTPAVVTVFLENNGADLRQVGKPTKVKGSAAGATLAFAEAWAPGAEYRVHVEAKGLSADITPNLTTPAEACQAEEDDDAGTGTGTGDTPTVPSKPSPSASSSPSATPPSEPSGSPATPGGQRTGTTPTDDGNDGVTPVGGSNNAPSAAAQESNLAETGANSRTGLIVGIGAALVAVGGGAVFLGTRRRDTGSR